MRKGQLKINPEDSNPRSEFHGLYQSWQDMKSRCYNKNHRNYRHWGGRGIGIYTGWQYNYEAFKKWSLKNGWKKSMTIDRIDNDGHYCPVNCRWISRKEQSLNLRNTNLYQCGDKIFSQRKVIDFLWTLKVGDEVWIKKLKVNSQKVGNPNHKNHRNHYSK